MSTLRDVLEARANSGYGVITHTELRTILNEHPKPDPDSLLTAIYAVLAVADVLDGRATTNHATAKQRHLQGDRVNAAAYQALEIAQMQTAQEIRNAVNNALEVGK